jgi:Tol biopolymer transport system component
MRNQTSWSRDGSLIAFTGWSPDGRIAFSRKDERGIFVVRAAGGHPDRVRGSFGFGAAWSPDGHRIATCDDTGTHGGIWAVPATGGRAQRLVAAGQLAGVSWRP